MRGTVFYGTGDIRFEDTPEPKITKPTDAIIRLAATCVCGSDLWSSRGINESAVRTAAERLVAAGHKAIAIRSDVTDEAQVKAMVEQTVSAFGRLDAAFNNAGVMSLAVETADATSQEFERVNAISLRK